MPLETPYIETELVARVAAGDEQAFAQLFYAWHQRLADYVYLLTRSMPLTEEIVQDSFTKIWLHRRQLTGVNNFQSYLFTISRNHTFNCLRSIAREAAKRQKWTQHAINEMDEEAGDISADPQRLQEMVDAAVSQLPPQQQKVWLLSRQKGLSHEEIGREMQLSRETVKRHISLALRSIREYVRANAGHILPGLIALLIGK
ncbi:MAG: RNA polymerase sigma-70 factor [Bacteroidetes bacterium]|nr:RNA polymerase sigma-70 factor [Bacteroidota bacterium]